MGHASASREGVSMATGCTELAPSTAARGSRAGNHNLQPGLARPEGLRVEDARGAGPGQRRHPRGQPGPKGWSHCHPGSSQGPCAARRGPGQSGQGPQCSGSAPARRKEAAGGRTRGSTGQKGRALPLLLPGHRA